MLGSIAESGLADLNFKLVLDRRRSDRGMQAYLVTIVGPAAEFHEARLHIKREVADVDFTGGLENGWRCPSNFPTTVKHCLRHGCHYVVAISARQYNNKREILS